MGSKIRVANQIYGRKQGKEGKLRYYGDFREYADVGGKREALVPAGGKRATDDKRLAVLIAAERIESLENQRRNRQLGVPEEDASLAAYASYHMKKKATSGGATPEWLEAVELHLWTAIRFFCFGGRPIPVDGKGAPYVEPSKDRKLVELNPMKVQQYLEWLRGLPNGRGEKLSSSSQRKYLNSLSNLFARALSEGLVTANPVAALIEKPQDGSRHVESRWLEVPDAARLLEASRGPWPRRKDNFGAMLRPILATLLLTGGRPREVFGLLVEDISFERKTVTFRPNEHRRLKTKGSRRVVPLWPQLEEILNEYLDGRKTESALLFPSPRTGGLITDIRKAVDEVTEAVSLGRGNIRPYAFRHTYAAARLQTLDKGAPVSIYTVARELGHGSEELVKQVYGHLGTHRHRSEVVEYVVGTSGRVAERKLQLAS